jgi:hypothetical protein
LGFGQQGVNLGLDLLGFFFVAEAIEGPEFDAELSEATHLTAFSGRSACRVGIAVNVAQGGDGPLEAAPFLLEVADLGANFFLA